MKTYPKKSLRVPCSAVLLAALAASSASAQTITKAGNSTSMNFGSSYVGGVAPTASNTLLIDNTLSSNSTTASIGTGISVLGLSFTAIPVSGAPRAFTIGSGSGTLSIGSGGLTKATDTSTFLVQANMVLTANQTWTINTVTGTGTGNFGIQGNISDGGFTATVGGAGRIDFTANTVTVGNGIILNTGQVVVNGSSAVVNFGNANTSDNYLIANGRGVGSVLGNFGTASSFGDGGTNTAITLGGSATSGILDYTGASASSNRTFAFDRRGAVSEIRNSNASSTLTLSGTIANSSGTFTGNTSISFGGNGSITLTGAEQIKDNTQAADSTTLNKNGSGTLTITGNNSNTNTTSGTYQGATNVNAGTLVISGTGAINSTSGISVNTTGTFRYDSSVGLTRNVTVNGGNFTYNSASAFTGGLTFTSGTVGGNNLSGVTLSIGTGKTLSPGNSPGSMSAGATTFADGGTFLFEINNAGGTAGTNWDLLNATSLDITAGVGGFTVKIASLLNPSNLPGAADGFVPDVSKSFLFVDTGAAITSFSATAFLVDTALFTNSFTGTWAIARGDTISGGDNTQLYVTYTVIPEPSTFAALAGFGAIGLALSRRRRAFKRAA